MPDIAKTVNTRFPNPVGRAAFARYSVAVVTVLVALGLRFSLTPIWGPMEIPFIFFYPAIVFSAWYGRARAGALAIILSALVADWFFIDPVNSFRLNDSTSIVAMISFVIVNSLLVAVVEMMHRARDRVASELAQRLRAEAQLAAEKELLATTLTSIGDAVIVTNEMGNVTTLNAEAQRLTGWSEAAASGRPLSEVFSILNEQTRDRAENPVDKVLRLGTVTGLANHTVLISKDGRETPIDDSAAPIRRDNGPIQGVVLVFRDVTEQRRAQQESARLAAIVEHSGDAIFTKDLNGVINSWNASAQRLFGYEPDEIIGKPVTVLFPADRMNEEDHIVSRLRDGKPSERLETIRVAKDGRQIPVSVSVSALRNGEGEIVGASKIIHDISELVAAREALKSEKELLATTLASIGDAVIVTDVEGRVTFLNSEAERLTGWTTDEAQQRPLQEVFQIVNEQTREEVENPVEKVIRLGGVVGLANHTVLIAKDGREIPIDDSAAPIRHGDGPMFGIVLVFRDFTDRKIAEERLAQTHKTFVELVERAPFGMYIIDSQFRIAHMNVRSQSGAFRNVQPVIGRDFGEAMRILWPEEVAHQIIGLFRRTLETGEPYYSPRFTNPRHDIEAVESYEWELHRITMADGQYGVVCYYYDSTELREAEQRQHELRATAEEANRLKDEFLAIMSHELRNPLNVILGYSELLVRTDEIAQSPALHRMTDAIKRNAQAQSKLIRDLVDLSRLRSSKLDLNIEAVSMLSTVEHAIDTVRAEADDRQIAIEVVALDEALFVDGDPVRLEQIVWNLLNNSVKFTPPGGKITVQLDKGDGDAVITVTDSGQGIDASFLPHVFEMFRQADGGASRVQAGMGVGLAVVQQLAGLHGGSVTAHSDGIGKGATFTIKLPLSTQAQGRAEPILDLTPTLERLSVLVVDDSEDTIEMLAQMLKVSGADVMTATSGHDALRLMSEKQFDIVLSDISMPEMDGFEFLRRLRQLPGHSDVPVLALTGFGRPEDVDRAHAEGFFSHVTKPFELEALMKELQKFKKKSVAGE